MRKKAKAAHAEPRIARAEPGLLAGRPPPYHAPAATAAAVNVSSRALVHAARAGEQSAMLLRLPTPAEESAQEGDEGDWVVQRCTKQTLLSLCLTSRDVSAILVQTGNLCTVL